MPRKTQNPRTQKRRNDVSMPFYTLSAELKTFHAQQIFARAYERFAGAVYSASIILRVFGEESVVRELEGAIDERVNQLFEDIRKERARLQAKADAEGISLASVTYSKPETVEARVTSPRSGRFIGVIREFDGMVQCFDGLWLAGAIPDGDYQRRVYEWKRRILRSAIQVSNLSSRALRAARQRGVRLQANDEPAAVSDATAASDGDSASGGRRRRDRPQADAPESVRARDEQAEN